jgi:cytochrome c-type biogenesis protein CcmH/NrfG
MNRLGLLPLASALLASTAVAQVRLPQTQPAVPVITPTGQAPAVQGAGARSASVGGVQALLQQAETQRQRGRKDLSAQALQRALGDSPNNPDVLQRLAIYAVQDGDFAAADTWTQKLRQAAGPKDARVAAVERQLKTAQAATASTVAPPPAEAPPIATQRRLAERPAPAPVQVAAAPLPVLAAPVAAASQAAAPQVATPKPPAAASADPGAQARTAGFLALNGGDLPAAERAFDQALKVRPGDLDAAGGLGVIRLQQQRFNDARELLSRAVRGPSGADRWGKALQTAEFFAGLDRARTAYNAGRYGEAEQEARRLADGSSANRIEAQVLLGQALERQNRPADAEAAFRQALAESPGRADAAAGMAQALADLGRYDDASRALAQVPASQASAVRSTIERARAADLLRRGDTFGAGAALASAVTAMPSDPWTRFDYARLLLSQNQVAQSQTVAAPLYTSSDPESMQAAALYSENRGRSAEAAAILRRIPENARNPAVRELAARFEGEQILDQAHQMGLAGQNAQAVAMVRNYLTRSSPSFEARSRIAQTLLDLGDAYQAGALALDAARNPPASFAPGDAGGFLTVLAQTGQDPAAMALLSAAARQGQTSGANQTTYRQVAATYAGQRADRLRNAGDFAGAFDTLSQAFALAPRDPSLLAALGRLYQSGNMPQQAQQAYDALLALTPNDLSALRGAAQAAQAAGDYARAERILGRAIRLRPNDPELFYQVGQMEQSRGHDRDALKAFERADALLKTGRGQSLLGAGGRPGAAGALGPNPFARPTAPTGPTYGIPAYGAAPVAPVYGGQASYAAPPAASAYGAGFTPMAMTQEAPAMAAPGGGVYPAQAEPPAYAAAIPANSAPYGAAPAFALPGAPAPAFPDAGYPAAAQGAPFALPGVQAQGGYPNNAYPNNYAAPGPADGGGAGLPAYAGPTPGADPAGAPGFALPAAPAGSAADAPLPVRIGQQIENLRESTSPRFEGDATLRARSGQQGTSELFEATMRAETSFSPFGVGQLGAAVSPVTLSAGAPDAAAAATLGTTPLAAAAAAASAKTLNLNTADTTQASGAAMSVFYRSEHLNADVGTTPLGFEETNLSAGVSGNIPLGGGAQLRGSVEERPVTDSVLAYAGVTDPQTGVKMGSVMRESGSFGGSVVFGQGGAYADGTYKELHGNNVAPNTGYEVNGGVYYRPIDSNGNRLQVGVNVNMQAYDKNLRFFSFGQGGYFSPQQFVSLALPLSYSVDRTRWHWNLGLTLGFQSYSEDSSPVFPTLPFAQAAMVDYASGIPTVTARYAGDDHTGMAVAALASGEYKILPNTATGAEFSLDTFGIYNEYKLRFYLRRTLTGLN